jgi:SAM-dependent methyltransferase
MLAVWPTWPPTAPFPCWCPGHTACVTSAQSQTAGWNDPDQVDWYLDRIDGLPPRLAGEDMLREVLPRAPETVLDLGCGDGRLAALVLEARSSVSQVLAVDRSPTMLGEPGSASGPSPG